ncbi:RNB domain-containing ribonuclease [Candidatus Mycoplasma haematominutum]|uniref:RNB domain-containing ribonuclease n=1 Tax=Candidatus Mycoplasma haematominutum TaxID=209446 RepID=UPI000302395A|nr:RNB domain-containing ribonuclease [Candidatus Mycoplasma haematominutum]
MNNDLVSFRVFKGISNCSTEKLEGEVVKVIERFKTRFVAEIIKFSRKKLEVFFDDPQLSGLREVWGYFQEVQVGDKVVIQLHQFPPARMEGEVLKTLGHSSSGKVDFFSLIADLQLPGRFDDDKFQTEINKLQEMRESILAKNVSLYKNLEGKCFFTVDGINAKDFDDAICAERSENAFKLYVAIADVWGYLSLCPFIFEEAKRRGTSIYLVDKVIPMLPPILSEDLCSLKEGEKRHTICLFIEVDLTGKIKEETLQIFPATIISQKRFNYQEVNEFLNKYGTEGVNNIYGAEIEKSVISAYHVMKLIQKQRRNEGYQSLKIFQDKFELELNEKGELTSLCKNELGGTEAQQLVETCMILANQLVARFLAREDIETLYRTHRKPEIDRLKNFVEEVRELGCDFTVPQRDNIGVEVNILNGWLFEAKNSIHYKIIQHNLLQALPKAEYRSDNIGHFGINTDYYVHFTSPIRRLPDLLIHKSLWLCVFLRETTLHHEIINSALELREMAYLANITEQRSVLAEKRFVSRKIYKYLVAEKIKKEIDGVVMSRFPWGYMVLIDQIYDGFVRTKEWRALGQVVKLRKVDYSWDEFVEC